MSEPSEENYPFCDLEDDCGDFHSAIVFADDEQTTADRIEAVRQLRYAALDNFNENANPLPKLLIRLCDKVIGTTDRVAWVRLMRLTDAIGTTGIAPYGPLRDEFERLATVLVDDLLAQVDS